MKVIHDNGFTELEMFVLLHEGNIVEPPSISTHICYSVLVKDLISNVSTKQGHNLCEEDHHWAFQKAQEILLLLFLNS